MGEIEEWFLESFGCYGFYIGPTIYNPFDFVPTRPILLTRDGETINTRLSITPEMANDLSGGFVPLPDPVQEYKDLMTNTIYEMYGYRPYEGVGDIKPHNRVIRFNFE